MVMGWCFMVSTREILGIIRYPSKKGYVAEVWYRVKEDKRVRIRVERIIEPYEKPLESVHLQKVRKIREKALTRLESKLKKVIKK